MSETREKRIEWDPIYLYTRTDEKYEEVRAEVENLMRAVQDVKNGLEKNEQRTEKAISFGTHKNTERITEMEKELKVVVDGFARLNTQLTDPETGFFKTVKQWKDSVDRLYTGIVSVFFGTIVVSVIVYMLKNFGLMR